jgi:uncharacterized membrane protein SpoIIM required for sporulation
MPERIDGSAKPLTRSERFIRERRERWLAFAELTEKAEKRPASLGAADLRDFPRLYRRACSDLAQARALKLARDVIEFLNDSVARARAIIYGRPPLDGPALRRFFSADLPSAVLRNWKAVIASAILFFAPYAVSLAVTAEDPDAAAAFISADTLDSMIDSYAAEVDGSSAGGSSYMTAFYIRNNVSIAFLSFATGILACLGSVYFLVYNGIFLGAVEGCVAHAGYAANLNAFTLAHSPLELTGLVLAGAAGLSLGFAVLRGGRYGRADALIILRKRVFPLIVAFVLCVGCAAFIEGFFSPHAFPLALKGVVAAGSGSALIGYFAVWPALARARKGRP